MEVFYSDKYNLSRVRDLLSAENYSIEKEILRFPDDSIYLFPTRRFGRYIQKKYIQKSGIASNQTVKNINIFSLYDFAIAILRNHSPDLEVVDEYKRHLLISDIIEQLKLQGRLIYYNLPNNSYHSLANITKIISELRNSGVGSDSFNDLKFTANDNYYARLSDIRLIFQEYEQIVKTMDLKWEDEFSVFKKATSIISHSNSNDSFHLYDSMMPITIAGFSKFKNYEIEFVKALALSSNNGFRIDFKSNPQNKRLFRGILDLKETLSQIKKLNYIYFANGDPINRSIGQSYFANKPLDTPIEDRRFNILERKDKIDEVATVADLVKYHHLELNVPLNEIVVVSNRSTDYSAYIREIFALESIPVNITDRYLLSESGVANALVTFLDSLTNGITKSQLISITKNHYLTIPGLETTSITDIESALYTYRIFNIGKWLSQRGSQSSDIITKASIVRLVKENYAVKYHKILQAIKKIYIRHQLPSKLTASEFKNRILDIIKEFRILDNVLSTYKVLVDSQSGELHTHNTIRHELEKDSQALNKLIEIINDFNFTTEMSDTKEYESHYLITRFKTVLTLTRYQIKELPNYGVTVTSIEQARELKYKTIFVLGMIEGEMPSNLTQNEPILRSALKQNKKQIYEYEKHLFFQLITNNKLTEQQSNQTFYFTYPAFSGDRKNSISHFLLELEKLLNTSPKSLCKYQLVDTDKSQTLHDTIIYNRKEVDFDISLDWKEEVSSARSLDERYLSYYKDKTDKMTFSISTLENFIRCPNRFLFSKTLSLNIKHYEETDDVYIGPREIGSYFHLILELFHKRILQSGKDIIPFKIGDEEIFGLDLSETNKEKYYELMNSCVDEIYDSEIDLQFLEHERESKKPILKRYIDFLINDIAQSGFHPVLAEYDFKNLFIISENTKIELRGTIDRIDLKRTNTNHTELRVIDYKTFEQDLLLKSIIASKSKRSQEKLQLPIYLWIANHNINSEEEHQIMPTSLGYIIIAPKSKNGKPVTDADIFNDSPEKISAAIEIRKQVIQEVYEQIRNTDYLQMPDKPCQYCPHPRLCKNQL